MGGFLVSTIKTLFCFSNKNDNNNNKPIKVGVSPEFEIALYTIIFLCGRNNNRLRFGNVEISIMCFKMERENRTVIATLFPSV
jgi:hypothetical protein